MITTPVKFGKNLVQIICADSSGCSHYRLRWNGLYCAGYDSLGFVPIVLPAANFDGGYLATTKAIIIQRPTTDSQVNVVKRYKALQPKYGYKLVFELDDQCFTINGEGLPDYNMASLRIDLPAVENRLREILPLFDTVVVSTEYLKRAIEETFDVHNVVVVKNVVPRFLWSYPRKKEITSNLVKPTVLYSGSPCHYRNPVQPSQGCPAGVSPLKGDWNNAWCDWIIKNVREDKINFVVMGDLPWFFDCIKDKITSIPWVDCNSFPRQVMETNADFSVGPLVNNSFNKCKSALRFYESAAAGQVFLGTVFTTDKDSPYEEAYQACRFKENMTIEEIDERFWFLCRKDNYNKVLNWQYDFLNTNGRWLESDQHINEWQNIVDNDSVLRKQLI